MNRLPISPRPALPPGNARILYARSPFWDTTFLPRPYRPDGLATAVFHRDDAELARAETQVLQKSRDCRANGAECSVLPLHGDVETVVGAAAEEPLGAPLRGPLGSARQEHRRRRDRPTKHLRGRAHRCDRPRPAL